MYGLGQCMQGLLPMETLYGQANKSKKYKCKEINRAINKATNKLNKPQNN